MLKELISKIVNKKILNNSKSMQIEIDSKIVNDFIYYIDNNNCDKLCILKFLKKKIFGQVYNKNHHVKIH